MSLPRQLTEQLLSAYLDDALSGDERARVDQMLAGDAAVRDQLAQMRRLQAETRQAFAVPPSGASQHKLDDRFAERVLQAAFAEARRANLSNSHPLRRAADRAAAAQPAPQQGAAGRGTPWGRHSVAAALALAAVLLLAVTLGRLSGEGDPAGGPAVAERDADGVETPTDMLAGPAQALAEQADALAQQADALAGPAEAVAATAGAAAPESAAATSAIDASAAAVSESMLAGGSATEPDSVIDSLPTVAPRSTGAPADPSGIEAIASAADQLAPLNLVMVLQVEQTELGRSQDAVLQALRQAGIRTGARRLVDQQIVGYLQQAKLAAASDAEGDESSVSILFIEAPGKQLDEFIVSLFQLPEQIAGVGLDLGMDPPLLAAAGQLSQVDPSTVQHAADTATAWQLVRGEDQDQFSLPPQQRAFSPLNSQTAGVGLLGGSLGAGGASTDSGPDITGRLLIVIR